jgi:hypothetical protein
MSEAPYPPAEPPADGDRTTQVPPPHGMAPRFSASASVPVPPAGPAPGPAAYASPTSQFGQGTQYGQPAPGAQFGPDGALGQPPGGQHRERARAGYPTEPAAVRATVAGIPAAAAVRRDLRVPGPAVRFAGRSGSVRLRAGSGAGAGSVRPAAARPGLLRRPPGPWAAAARAGWRTGAVGPAGWRARIRRRRL